MTSSRWIVLLLSAVMVGFGVVWTIQLRRPLPPRDVSYRNDPYNESVRATVEGPPVIVLKELEKRGLDEKSAENIEPHFHVLNAALVTMVELQARYVLADAEQQKALNAEAVPFHATADRHQRAILELLPMPQETIFDNYVAERKRVVGLNDWHPDHSQQTPLGGLVRPPEPKH